MSRRAPKVRRAFCELCYCPAYFSHAGVHQGPSIATLKSKAPKGEQWPS
jgi:hypothetical protein